MLHLSRLTLNPLHREARAALADLSAMHRLVWRGFPDGVTAAEAAKSPDAGRFLYRVEAGGKDGRPFVLVQSALETSPDWSPLERTGVLESADAKEFRPAPEAGQLLRFRLRATPTKREKTGPGRPDGRRVGLLREDDQLAWLARKGDAHGFAVVEARVTPLGALTGARRAESGPSAPRMTHTGVEYDGVLRVTDPTALVAAVASGIGAGKAWGFGLLSLARAA